MAKLIRNKVELEKFHMGIEFEFYVKRNALVKNFNLVNPIPDNILNKYGHLFNLKNQTTLASNFNYEDAGKYFLNELKNIYPEENWKKIFKITYDGSVVTDSQKIGVEMILIHDNANITMNRLRKVLTILNTSQFMTTKDCGLHINISFNEQAANRKDLVVDVAKNLDIDKILAQFERKNNEHCKSNLNTEIDSYGFRDEIMEGMIKTFITDNKKKSHDDYSLKTIFNMINNLKDKKNFEKFATIVESIAKEKFMEDWGNYDRPAIAPKTHLKKNYLEFRLMGGKDYHKKIIQIENGISDYLKAMKKSHFDYQKQINKAPMKKLIMA